MAATPPVPRPSVFWLYGLSGAGKTTHAHALAAALRQRGTACLVLDGDEFRASVSSDLGFSPADRAENIRRAAAMARLACAQGFVVIAAFITPTVALRDTARTMIAPLPFFEVFLDCDYATAATRDVKGLYAQAAAGRLKNFTGNDAAFEPPATPDLRLNTQAQNQGQCLKRLLAFAERRIASQPDGCTVMPGSESLSFTNPVTDQIARFLRGIGLPVWHGTLDGASFLPGLALDAGRIIIDEAQLLYPGDVLHEAGHLAVTPAAERSNMDGNLDVTMGDEIGAIIWSYAAALHIGIDPAIVFHPHGYRNSSSGFLENFRAGRYVGVPLLQWMGLTLEPRQAEERGIEPFPHMIQWLRS